MSNIEGGSRWHSAALGGLKPVPGKRGKALRGFWGCTGFLWPLDLADDPRVERADYNAFSSTTHRNRSDNLAFVGLLTGGRQ